MRSEGKESQKADSILSRAASDSPSGETAMKCTNYPQRVVVGMRAPLGIPDGLLMLVHSLH